MGVGEKILSYAHDNLKNTGVQNQFFYIRPSHPKQYILSHSSLLIWALVKIISHTPNLPWLFTSDAVHRHSTLALRSFALPYELLHSHASDVRPFPRTVNCEL